MTEKYDTLGRFNQVSNFQSHASYSCLPNSDLISGLSSVVGPLSSVSTRSYEDHRNLLTQVKNIVGSEIVSQYDYANDAGGRRTLVKNSGTGFQPVGNAFNLYGYNTRSEVISAERFFGSDPQSPGAPMAGQNWDYDFDHIGNRKTAARDGDTEVYAANNLNQYTQRTVPGVAQVAGTAAEDATVTINRPSISGITVEPVTRQGAYFHKKLALDNSSRSDVEEIEVVGVKAQAGTNGADIVSSYSGVVWAAQSPEQFSYDEDGNMFADALRSYEWDGENRLIAVTSSNVVDGSLTRVVFFYDYMSRRASKTVYVWSASSNEFQISSFSTFLYDGWNMIKEISTTENIPTGLPSSRVVDYYVWGLDLSGSLQGAGGIGGLLGRVRKEERFFNDQGLLIICHRPPGNPDNCKTLKINASAWPAHSAHGDTLGSCAGATVSSFLNTFDANGNVSELLQSSVVGPLSSVAHYEYSPFGETIVSTGPEAQDNPFRFSTKYFVDELGIGDWGWRWYHPDLGRWLSRDPIEELDCLNLYEFVCNAPIGVIDADGRSVGLITLSLAIKCLGQGLLAIPDVRKITQYFQNDLDPNYICCWKGKSDKHVRDWDDPDNQAVSYQVLHRMVGCKLREAGVTADCMAAFNLVFELYELAFTDEFKDKGRTIKERLINYVKDTFSDMGAIVGGYSVGPPDCEDKFIPSECHPN